MKINCYTCHYGLPKYDRFGLVIGVSCSCNNLIDIQDSEIWERSGDCTLWAEKEVGE